MAARRATHTLTRVMVTALFFLSGYVPRHLRVDAEPRDRINRRRTSRSRRTR